MVNLLPVKKLARRSRMAKNPRRVIRRVNRVIEVWECTCERCGYKWDSEAPDDRPPTRCASCKFPHWNVPPGTLKKGPKPKERSGDEVPRVLGRGRAKP